MFAGWFRKMVRESMNELAGAQVRESTQMERMFGNCSPAVVAFKIENGFVVRTLDMRREMEGHMQGGFHYCKDHQEIAEHIIATEAKRKLGLGEQQEMFPGAVHVSQEQVQAFNPNLTTTGRFTNRSI